MPALTDRQREVAALHIQGLSHAEIAERLGIQKATSRMHVWRVRQALGVPGNNRVRLAEALGTEWAKATTKE